MIDKSLLLSRLEQMKSLPSDWDGFGTEPLSQKVFVIANQILDVVSEETIDLRIFVGINNPGSLYLEFDLTKRNIEMTILDSGVIHFDEMAAGSIADSDCFQFSIKKVEDLLKG